MRRAIATFEQVLLRGHIAGRVPDRIRKGRDEEVLSELAELFALARR